MEERIEARVRVPTIDDAMATCMFRKLEGYERLDTFRSSFVYLESCGSLSEPLW